MARMTKVGVGYNIQIAVDAKHSLIAEQHVTNKVLDYGHLTETAEAAKDVLDVDALEVVADRGYLQAENIEACEKAGMMPYVPKPNRGPAKRESLFPKEQFVVDPERDGYVCPGGRFLRLRSVRKERAVEIRMYTGHGVCGDCALKAQCTKSGFRQLSRYANEALLERMADRVNARPELQDIRRQTVEHPFGTIKQWMGQGAFLMRRLENVRGEFSLTALAYNIRRAITIIGDPGLIRSRQGLKTATLVSPMQTCAQTRRSGSVRPSNAVARNASKDPIPLEITPTQTGEQSFHTVCKIYARSRMFAARRMNW